MPGRLLSLRPTRRRRALLAWGLALLAAPSLAAQEPTAAPPAAEETAEPGGVAALRAEIDALRADYVGRSAALEGRIAQLEAGGGAAPAPAGVPPAPPEVTAAVPPEAAAGLPTGVPAGGAPYTGNYFNPSISMIGNFLAAGGHSAGGDSAPSADLRESELGLQAIIDPYARADFFLSFGEEGAGSPCHE